MEAETDGRVNKRQFIAKVAARSSLPIRTVGEVYESMMTELIDITKRGDTVVLTGFGRFYLQRHKGHKVRFGRADIKDYPVLKFSASPRLNKRLREDETMLDGSSENQLEYAVA